MNRQADTLSSLSVCALTSTPRVNCRGPVCLARRSRETSAPLAVLAELARSTDDSSSTTLPRSPPSVSGRSVLNHFSTCHSGAGLFWFMSPPGASRPMISSRRVAPVKQGAGSDQGLDTGCSAMIAMPAVVVMRGPKRSDMAPSKPLGQFTFDPNPRKEELL